MIIVLLEPAFLFFVLTSGRPLPVTTFFVFSKPLCSADRDSGIFCTAAKALFIAVKGLSTAAKICGCCSPALLQLFCSASWSHSASQCPRPIFIHSPTEHYYPATLFKLYLFLSLLFYGSSSVQMLYSFPATAMLLSTHTRKCQQLTMQTLF